MTRTLQYISIKNKGFLAGDRLKKMIFYSPSRKFRREVFSGTPCSWTIGEVKVVIEMVVDEKDDRDVHKVIEVVTREWRKAESAETGIRFSF